MITKSFKSLIQHMKLRKPVLLLGAGFSYGAVNGQGDTIKMGTGLAEDLFTHFYGPGSKPSITSKDLMDIIEKNRENLKEICSYLRIQGMCKERDDYLVRLFSRCTLKEDATQWSIVKYPWSHIFTLNIDDLIEDIYSKMELPISVWDLSHPRRDTNSEMPLLIKLHGSVNDKDSGFIFDNEEYRNYTIDSNSMLKEFAHQIVSHDIIMIGTEFQEDDLLTMLSIYEKCGYDTENYKRFYITPSINNVSLRLKIENSSNEIWIQATTDDFMRELEKNIVTPEAKRESLAERGVFFLNRLNKQVPSSMGIYKGEESVYADFIHDIDIVRPDLIPVFTSINNAGASQIVSLYGDSFIGKTCCAKRLLVNLSNKGYDAIQIHYLDKQISSLLINYWETLSFGTNVAVYVERASYCYFEVLELLKECPKNISRIVLVTEDTYDNHQSKRYLLLNEKNYMEYEIKPVMNYDIAHAVYDKLSRKSRLGHYLDCLPSKSNVFEKKSRDIIVTQIMKEQDIIDALYYASEGRSFKKHYESWLKNNVNEDEYKLLQQVCCFGQLGIDRIPVILFNKLGQKTIRGFSLKDYVRKYNEIVKRQNSYVVFRRSRILNEVICTNDYDLNTSLLKDVATFCVPYTEYENTEWEMIFLKAIRVKRIKKHGILSNECLFELLSSLESSCNHVSYFWVQYGIAAQALGNYEDANNHLSYAKNMRPNSYQVRHALAKNNMEWGLSLIRDGYKDIGTEKFNLGVDELRGLINNRMYSDSYRYSAHTMVHMFLQYYSIIHETMNKDICAEISIILEKLLDSPLDSMLIELIKHYIEYCDSHGLSFYCKKLRSIYHRTEARKADASTYDID